MESRDRRHRSGLIAAGLLCAASIASAAPERYVIDPAHTYPGFAIGHLGISQLRGRFNKTTGWIELDRQAKAGRLDVTIDVTSLDTGLAPRDRNLLQGTFGAALFDAERFPEMHYRADRMVYDGDVPVAIDGELTLLGVTRPVMLVVRGFQCAFNPLRLAQGCGAQATARLKRSEFGMLGLESWIADEVDLVIDVEAYPETLPTAGRAR
ncbi:YceI family protein [Chitinivorax sp. PXF-14]|uniref:YceI family protein n=1 Tax=Chitinivorax sp. PXF-14 TaxID=3230488 RepID=UPI0034673BBC